MTSQFRRAGVSIPANIAEGYKRIGRADKARFYNIAQSSLEECRYYWRLSKDLNYLTEDIYIKTSYYWKIATLPKYQAANNDSEFTAKKLTPITT